MLELADVRPVPTAAAHAPQELADCVAAGVYRPSAELPIDTWIAHGRMLARRWAALLWLIADWARTGVDYYGPLAWSQLSEISGRDRDTLRKMVKLSRAYPPDRRRLAIPFSRHIAVLTLPDAVADRLLLRAEREGWTQLDLARQIRVARGQPSTKRPTHRSRQVAPAGRTITTPLVTPDVTDYRQTAPVRCSGCLLTVAYAVGTRAVTSSGPAAVQRVETGQLTMNVECGACSSTTLISLSALEIPTAAGLNAVAG